VKQQELKNSESESAIDVLPVFNFLEIAVHRFIYVGQLGLVRSYDDNDNTFIHICTVGPINCCNMM
jgi:hypothetical protein